MGCYQRPAIAGREAETKSIAGADDRSPINTPYIVETENWGAGEFVSAFALMTPASRGQINGDRSPSASSESVPVYLHPERPDADTGVDGMYLSMPSTFHW